MLGQQHLNQKSVFLLQLWKEQYHHRCQTPQNQLIMFDSHTEHNIFFRSNNYDYNHEINKAYIGCLKNPFHKLYFAASLRWNLGVLAGLLSSGISAAGRRPFWHPNYTLFCTKSIRHTSSFSSSWLKGQQQNDNLSLTCLIPDRHWVALSRLFDQEWKVVWCFFFCKLNFPFFHYVLHPASPSSIFHFLRVSSLDEAKGLGIVLLESVTCVVKVFLSAVIFLSLLQKRALRDEPSGLMKKLKCFFKRL